MNKKSAQSLRKSGLAFKLVLLILTSTTLIFASAFIYNYKCSREIVLNQVHESVHHLTRATVNQIETVLNSVQGPPVFLANYLKDQGAQGVPLENLLRHVLESHEAIYGSAAAFEPNRYDPSTMWHCPYGYKKDGEFVFTQLGNANYNYLLQDWYLIPKELQTPIWSEPYFDEGGGNIIMATYSAPFYRMENGHEVFTGIVTADLSLEWLVDMISAISLYQTGYAFLISHNGVFVTHPDPSYIMKESWFGLAEKNQDAELRRIGKDMVRGGSGFVPFHKASRSETSWIYYAPIPAAQWSLGIVIPERELFADLNQLLKEVLLIGLGGFLLLLAVILFISDRITKPIRQLARTTSEIAKGNLDISLPSISSSDEVGDLSHSFENMRAALKEYIQDLTETTAAKERIESELKIAHNIQMSFLPKHFPPFPEREEMDLFAQLEPAKEVGGDLYDFFLLDSDHLFFSIGDVSGKGVPAALFMAVSKTLMKGTAAVHVSPADLLMKVNNELAQDNESSMFVTVFCGVLNLRSGELTYSNAAHNPPVWIRNHQRAQWLEMPRGFLLGPMMNMTYENRTIQLSPGDLLVAYTDGVNEAMNPEQEFYTDARILQTLDEQAFRDPEACVRGLMQSVRDFAREEPQSDDITLLAVRFNGSGKAD